MIKEILLPEISENVDSGDVIKVLVSVGDTVEVDQPLVELETEKAVFEVPSTVAGVVSEITVQAGDTVDVGAVIAKIEAGASTAPETKAAEPKSEAPAKAEPKVQAPPTSSEPSPPPPPSETDLEKVEEAVVAVAQEPVAPPSRQDGLPAPASPSVRRLARELGIDINTVAGTGAVGRISPEDVRRFAKGVISGGGKASKAGVQSSAGVAPRALPDFSKFGDVETEAMSRVRSVTARNMAAAWNTVPHVTQHDDADITEMEATRKDYGKVVEAAGGKLTMTSILVKVCASALRRFPDFNASIDVAGQQIIFKKYVNIGIAVDTPRGLLVPVIRNADAKNIVELSVDVSDIAKRARDKKITPGDLEGGCFTISNLGGIGGTSFTPIVNAPEVAILGVSRAKMTPVYNGEKFTPRLIMPLSLSYDHRLIDGREAVSFLKLVKEYIEDPSELFLEL